jgi:tripartite-type tricarboxylate transporter receptor subunit TctC
MLGPRAMTPQQAAYWDSVFAKVVETDEWKKMLERDLLADDYLRSGDARNFVKAQYDEWRRVLTEFGIAKQQ